MRTSDPASVRWCSRRPCGVELGVHPLLLGLLRRRRGRRAACSGEHVEPLGRGRREAGGPADVMNAVVQWTRGGLTVRSRRTSAWHVLGDLVGDMRARRNHPLHWTRSVVEPAGLVEMPDVIPGRRLSRRSRFHLGLEGPDEELLDSSAPVIRARLSALASVSLLEGKKRIDEVYELESRWCTIHT